MIQEQAKLHGIFMCHIACIYLFNSKFIPIIIIRKHLKYKNWVVYWPEWSNVSETSPLFLYSIYIQPCHRACLALTPICHNCTIHPTYIHEFLTTQTNIIIIYTNINMIHCATPGRVPIFVCHKSWLCCHLTNIFNLQNESFLYLLLPGKYNF